jgi:hypothetical protein
LRPASISRIAWCPIKRIRREKPEVAAHLGLLLFWLPIGWILNLLAPTRTRLQEEAVRLRGIGCNSAAGF